MIQLRSILTWFETRTRGDLVEKFLINKKVPLRGFSVKHYLGGAILFLFVLQVLTGILMSLYYVPTVDGAFHSIKMLVTQVEYGWIVRSIHKWAANLMIVIACFHLLTVFWSGAYRTPRELTWISGLVLLGSMLAVCFFGYLLPWNDLSYSATSIGIEIVRKIPMIGVALVNVLQGGSEFTPRMLSVFFVFHTILLPLFMLGVIVFHVYLIQVHGMHEPRVPESLSKRKGIRNVPFHPYFLKRILVFWVVLLNAVVLLALLFSPELGEEANRFAQTPANIKPEWCFLFLYQTLKIIPPRVLFVEGEVMVLGMIFIVALYLAAFPFLESADETSRRNTILRGVVLIIFFIVLLMGIWGYLSRPLATQ
ncbi:MAG: cytochrome bc complex cytochrome b subunit [Candidatus Aminicenantes bacterium]|nr:cytochrome bc complex cytochrome b subunit [Candidatus Aminicenantes bacterium]